MEPAHLELSTDSGTRHVPLTGPHFTLGRAADSSLALDGDPAVSRRHAVLSCDDDVWSVTDVGSSNGTQVNGRPLQATHRLAPGDRITLGSQHLVFQQAADDGGGTGYLGQDEEWSAGPEATGVALPRVPAAASPTQEVPTAPPRTPPPAPPPPPPSAEPGADLERSRGTVTVRGVARAVVVRPLATSQNNEEALYFRVDQYDATGNRLPAVGVQFAPLRSGHLSDGEEVEVAGRFKKGTLHAQRVRNLATGAELTGQGGAEKVALGVATTLVVLFILACAIAVLYGFLTAG